MPRLKDGLAVPQASFDFNPRPDEAGWFDPEAPIVGSVPASLVACVVQFDDARRRRHFEAVRKLLSQTGVFDVR